MLKPGSINLKESEAMLMEELKMFEDQEEKTLHNFEAESRSLSKYSQTSLKIKSFLSL